MGWDPGEGNYLRKARKNFFISTRCSALLHELSMEFGINHSAVIELAVREMYQKYIGKAERIKPTDHLT